MMLPEDKSHQFWKILIYVFSFGVSSIAIESLGENAFYIFILFPALSALLIITRFGMPNALYRPNSGCWLPLLPIFLWMIWSIFIEIFGAFSIPAILFHYQYDLDSNGIAWEIGFRALGAALPFLLVAGAWWGLARRNTTLQRLGRMLLLPFTVLNPFSFAVGTYLATAYAAPPVNLNEIYADPTLVAAPTGTPKNLIRVILESTERTLWDEELFGDVAAPLKRLEMRGFSAHGIVQLEQSGWTLAGMVASDCGVPLSNLGAIQRNSYSYVDDFMPKARCLSDILSDDGYKQVFIKGAKLSFSGTDRFLASHKHAEALGFDELAGAGEEPDNAWGLDDEKIFSTALKKIEQLSNGKSPYHLTLLTIGGHSPYGYVSEKCKTLTGIMKHESETMRAMSCTNTLTEEFIKTLEERNLLKNTVVVIQSDHLAMRNDIYAELESKERRNTFILLAEGIRPGKSAMPAGTIDIGSLVLQAQRPSGSIGYIADLAKRDVGQEIRCSIRRPRNIG